MTKFSLKRLLLAAVAVLPFQLSAQSTDYAVRIGAGSSPVMTPMSQTQPATHFSMPQTFSGVNNIRSSFKPVAIPASESRKMVFKAPGSNINIAGDVVFSQNLRPGFYNIPVTATGEFNALNNTFGSLPTNNFGAVAIDNVYYVAWQYDFFGMMLINYVDSYDMNTWERIGHEEIKNTSMFATDVSLDPVSGYVYGCYINDDNTGYVFGMADYKNLYRVAIKPLSTAWNGVAFDADGTLYAIDMNGDLLIVDRGTGATTMVGNTGVTPKYQSSAVIDPKSGRMFWSVFGEDETGRFYEVDKTTGKATELYQFPGNEEVCGLVVIAPEAEDYAPAAVTNLTLNFAGGSLSGTVDFTAPDTYFCGETPLVNSETSYRVLANDVEVATGTCMYGDEVKAPVTLTAAGKYEFAVCVSNNDGASPYVKAEDFIGADTPVATKATLVRDGDNLVLSWTPVTQSVNGGYIDVDNITYTVTRFPDNVVVADHIAATTYSEPIPAGDDLISYYYTVVAHSGDITSGTAKSNSVTTGSVNPPYASSFNTSNGLDGYTTINANNDIKAWQLKNGAAYLPYSSSLDSDDWLITPPMRLKKGCTYKVDYILYTESNSYKEKVEVKWGTSATVEGMTDYILEPYEFASLADVPFETYITPEADGIYYIGIHGISTKYMYGLFVMSINVSAPLAVKAPAEVTGLSVVPDYNGANKATIKFNAPAVDILGNALESLTAVELLRDGTLIHTFESPAPGAELSYTDEVAASGNYTYTVIPVNNDGKGKPAEVTGFIGINKPGKVSNLKAFETATPGEVTFTWDEATNDVDGNPLNPALITYSIYEFTTSSKYVPVVENIKETTYTFQAVTADEEQQMKQWVVCAVTASGAGSPVATDLMCVGPNYQMPFVESVADGKLSYNFSMDQAMGGVWRLYTSQTLAEPTAVDGDNGILGMKGNGVGTYGSIISGKIEISGNTPVLTFYTFNINGINPTTGATVPDENILNVYLRCDGNETRVQNIVMKSLPAEGWNIVSVPLDAYKGKVIYIRFEGVSVNYDYVLVDNIRVADSIANDLAVAAVEAPASVNAGEQFNIDVLVENLGYTNAEGYTVNLYRDGQLVDSAEGNAVAPFLNTTVSFTQSVKITDNDTAEFMAEVIYGNDENTANNKSEAPVIVNGIFPNHPVPSQLSAVTGDNGVTLSWTAPELDMEIPDAVTETFETAESFATSLDGWTFIDVDGKAIGGLSGVKFPGIDSYSEQSFFVLDNSDAQFNATYHTHSGNKCLVSIYEAYLGAIDDWAISPRLSGEAQTVSLYARSYHNVYHEDVELLYSTGSLDPNDFISIEKFNQISGEWTELTADLPEGARYFAIRSCATGGMMLMIDDVTYIPAPVHQGLEHIGYNVYRNGVQLNEAPVTDTTLTDTLAEEGDHTYAVTAVYNAGESKAAKVTVKVLSGIDGVTADDNAPVEYFNLQGIRVDAPRAGNVYIRRQGTKSEKVVF
ncbi:MAG: hypothetical protein HDS52_01235 [Barnesiella sp.]|nr:hypothetical protein [Barnesiella sp.]